MEQAGMDPRMAEKLAAELETRRAQYGMRTQMEKLAATVGRLDEMLDGLEHTLADVLRPGEQPTQELHATPLAESPLAQMVAGTARRLDDLGTRVHALTERVDL